MWTLLPSETAAPTFPPIILQQLASSPSDKPPDKAALASANVVIEPVLHLLELVLRVAVLQIDALAAQVGGGSGWKPTINGWRPLLPTAVNEEQPLV